jgi:hypothetical protein
MTEINKDMQTPSIDQIKPSGREIYYKEHEFRPEYQLIVAELGALIDDSEDSSSIIVLKRKEIIEALRNHTGKMNDVSMVSETKIRFIIDELINVDSAYERLYRKILADIESINTNIRNRTQTYNVPSSYKNAIKDWFFDRFGRKSPYVLSLTDASENDRWTIRNPNSSILLRDMDIGDRMITFPFVLDPNIAQNTYVELFSFSPLQKENGAPVFLAELIISGDLYTFKGYLKSENIDRNGKRGAVFISDYAVSYEIPFSFRVVYDKDINRAAFLFKYDETPNKFTTVVKLDFSLHLLVGRELIIDELNTIFSEPIAV